MPSFSSLHITTAIIIYLCLVAPSASEKIDIRSAAGVSRYRATPSQGGLRKPTRDSHYNATSIHGQTRRMGAEDQGKTVLKSKPTSKVKEAMKTPAQTPTPTKRRRQNDQPTPEPTGEASVSTTVFVDDANTFALLLPRNPGEMVSDAEEDGVAYCTNGDECGNAFPDGFITGAAYLAAPDGSYVQVTGCMDASKFPFASNDDGGQFDNRFPNGAQCTFGGYGASFIELVEPSANRFCLRCCKSANDQQNCNSHQDRNGCPAAIPGTYEFGGVNCS